MHDRTEHSNVEIMRHSFSHVLASAVLRLHKNSKLGIGPAIDNGFYHDFQFPMPIGQKDLEKIEEEMKNIIEEELPFQQVVVSKEQALDILNLQGQVFKTEILKAIPDETVSFYKTGTEFMDLCRGPHVEHTGKLHAFKLTGISGVYWNNDENRPQLQRIHGVAFETEEDLAKYFEEQEQKKDKDHRKLAQKLELYTFDPMNGGGLPIWLPKGAAITRIIKDYVHKENSKDGYQYVDTPILSKTEVFNQSEDVEENKNFMYPEITVEDEEYSLKARSLPHLIQIFNSKKRSYRDLPFKVSEFSTLFRNEKSGELSGLTKIRQFTKDGNLIICSREQVKQVITDTIKQTQRIYEDFGLKDYRIELAMRGSRADYYYGNPKAWYKLEELYVEIAKSLGITLFEAPGSAEKEGPGLNFIFKDVFGRELKLGTIFFDLKAANDYGLKYVDSTNRYKIPFVINRTALGSIERFFGILLEHLSGSFPLWLSPIQVCVIPISEKYTEYSKVVHDFLIEKDINVSIDTAPETMQNKIRTAQMQMIPYMIIIGEKEMANKTISVRPRSGQDLGMMKLDEFLQKIRHEINEKVVF